MIIRTLRENNGWSQEQLADVSGVSVRTIQRIEKGGRGSLESLKCLAAVFETTIPELKEPDMPDETKPVESQEPAGKDPLENNAGLSDEDRAALKYARHLRQYDSWYDDENGWDGEDRPDDPRLSSDENRILRQVRGERAFYHHLISYLIVIGFLLLVNLITNPGYLWFLWAALGWGIAVLLHGIDLFGTFRLFGQDWERKEVEKRLRKMAGPGTR